MLGLVGLVAALVAGCGGGSGEGAKATPTPRASATAEATATATPQGAPPVAEKALARARRLPLEQRVGQLFLVGFDGIDLAADVFTQLRGHGWGGIYVGPTNAFDLTGVGVFAGEAVAVARAAKRPVPLVSAFDDDRPPRLGSNPKEGRTRAAASARAAKAQGVTLTTAPFIDVGLEADAKLIAKVAPAAVAAWTDAGVASAPGHFPGQGAVTQDPLNGPANVGLTREGLDDRDLRPWRTALEEAPAVTVSSATFTAFDPVTPAALEPEIVRGLLRDELRFGGVAVTDDLAGVAAQTGGSQAKAAVKAIRAGIDLVFVPDPEAADAAYDAVLAAAEKGRIPAGRIREAAARVLALKSAL